MRTVAALLVLGAALLSFAASAGAQVPRIPIFRPPPIVRPVPVRPFVPPPHIPVFPHGNAERDRNQGRARQDNGAWKPIAFIFGGLGVVVLPVGIVYAVRQGRRSGLALGEVNQPPDLIHSAEMVAHRVRETENLLEALARYDAQVVPWSFRGFVHSVFMLAQRCWEARDYGPVQVALTPELYARHTAAVQKLRAQHLFNHLGDLAIQRLELVHVCWPAAQEGQELTALITFTARSRYLDDRSGALRAGRDEVAHFQGFWVFRRCRDGWRLADIDQTRQSRRLRQANFVAPEAAAAGMEVHDNW